MCVVPPQEKFVPQQTMQWNPYGSQRTACVDQFSSPTTGHQDWWQVSRS
ncbi:rCG47461 [Rattus norvegicus]|uniref:RCG47461 n=1 Tax=Rattus norvegicus TaxID=10116 RepID=A6HYL6_RAT|nr:rCG47461 [Rattus norvegicus]